MADLQNLLAQLIQGQLDLQAHIVALAAAPPSRKKVVADPGSFNGSPVKFHKWWSKLKVWIEISMEGANDATVAAAVFSRLTGPKAGQWAQVRLDQCMVATAALAVALPLALGAPLQPPAWPTRAELEQEIETFFLPSSNQEWARAQCHDRVTPCDSARPLDCCRLKSDHDRTPPTLRIHLCSDN